MANPCLNSSRNYSMKPLKHRVPNTTKQNTVFNRFLCDKQQSINKINNIFITLIIVISIWMVLISYYSYRSIRYVLHKIDNFFFQLKHKKYISINYIINLAF